MKKNNIKKTIGTLNILTLLFVSILIIIFGREFTLIKIGSFPGFIVDYTLLFLIILQIINIDFWKTFLKNNYFYLVYFIIFFSYYSFQAHNSTIELIGKDFIFLLYPLIIGLILFSSKNKMDMKKLNFLLFSSIYSIFLITDFILDRAPFIESFLGIKLAKYSLPWVNLLDLKITEMTLFLILFLHMSLKNNDKYIYLNILPGVYLGFAVYESRTVLLGLTFYLIINLFLYRNTKVLKFVSFLFIGFIISLTLNYKNENLIKESMGNFNESTISSQINQVGFSRIRLNNSKCIYSNFLDDKLETNCEIRFENSFSNPLPLLSEVEYGFKNNLYQSELDLKYRGSFNNSIKNLDSKFTDREEYFDYLKICSSNSHLPVSGTKVFNCDLEVISISNSLISINNSILKEVCPSNVAWRLNLWTAMSRDLVDNNRLFTGQGVGFSIPQKLVNENAVSLLCYSESINSANPLRSGHNTFLTMLYRFGLINFIIFLFIAIKFFTKHIKYSMISLLVFVSIVSLFDPLLETTVTAVPFWFFIFYSCMNKANDYDD